MIYELGFKNYELNIYSLNSSKIPILIQTLKNPEHARDFYVIIDLTYLY